MWTLFIQTVALMVLAFSSAGCADRDEPESLDAIKDATLRGYPKVSHVSSAQVVQWLQDENAQRPILLDVREPEEHEVSHLNGAVLVAPDAEAEDLVAGVLRGVPKDRKIVLYCSVGVRSAAAATRLVEYGFTNVHNLNGSIFEWANEGHPVYRGNMQVQEVHPYSARWARYLRAELRAGSR